MKKKVGKNILLVIGIVIFIFTALGLGYWYDYSLKQEKQITYLKKDNANIKKQLEETEGKIIAYQSKVEELESENNILKKN